MSIHPVDVQSKSQSPGHGPDPQSFVKTLGGSLGANLLGARCHTHLLYLYDAVKSLTRARSLGKAPSKGFANINLGINLENKNDIMENL